jgi:hypothetical protein
MTTFSPKTVRSVAQAAVLRQPLLRDVHAGHDLQARDESFVDPLRQIHHFFQQAVETMPDKDALFHRLDVDVARLALDAALHDQVDQVDDRRGLAALFQPGDRFENFLFDAARERRLAKRALAFLAASAAARSGNRRQL